MWARQFALVNRILLTRENQGVAFLVRGLAYLRNLIELRLVRQRVIRAHRDFLRSRALADHPDLRHRFRRDARLLPTGFLTSAT